MPAKPSGEIKTVTVRQKRKNGDIYVIERKVLYDPEKKRNVVISSKLTGKIPKGTEILVETRAKHAKKQNPSKTAVPNAESDMSEGHLTASRTRIGMMEIVGHMGRESGIDNALYSSTDVGTAQKVISIARYLFCMNGHSLPGIATWQYNHPLPYPQGIFEDTYHRLFRDIGFDEEMQQNFFRIRCSDIGAGSGIAYDSTTYSTYSDNQVEARYGYNKAGDGLKAVKYLTLYSIEDRQPIAFTKEAGDVPDVVTVGNALAQLLALGMDHAEFVTDNGYYSASNLAEMLLGGFSFITLAQTRLKWIRPEIDSHREELGKVSSTCPFDPSTHGVSVKLMHEFVKIRKYASRKTGAEPGDKEKFSRRIYLHIFYNAARKAAEDSAFDEEMLSLKTVAESDVPIDGLDATTRKKIGKYLVIRTWGSKTVVSFNEGACDKVRAYHGYFVLVSNKEKDTFEALRKYRKREHIEDYFRASKQNADSTRLRVWNGDTLRGRMFVQFVALCYYEYYSKRIREIKSALGIPNGNSVHDQKKNIDLEKKLKSWLENTPIYLQLQWFDAVETVQISSELRSKRWSTEVTERDQLLLDMLGVKF